MEGGFFFPSQEVGAIEMMTLVKLMFCWFTFRRLGVGEVTDSHKFQQRLWRERGAGADAVKQFDSALAAFYSYVFSMSFSIRGISTSVCARTRAVGGFGTNEYMVADDNGDVLGAPLKPFKVISCNSPHRPHGSARKQ